MALKWIDTYDIAIELEERHPDVDGCQYALHRPPQMGPRATWV